MSVPALSVSPLDSSTTIASRIRGVEDALTQRTEILEKAESQLSGALSIKDEERQAFQHLSDEAAVALAKSAAEDRVLIEEFNNVEAQAYQEDAEVVALQEALNGMKHELALENEETRSLLVHAGEVRSKYADELSVSVSGLGELRNALSEKKESHRGAADFWLRRIAEARREGEVMQAATVSQEAEVKKSTLQSLERDQACLLQEREERWVEQFVRVRGLVESGASEDAAIRKELQELAARLASVGEDALEQRTKYGLCEATETTAEAFKVKLAHQQQHIARQREELEELGRGQRRGFVPDDSDEVDAAIAGKIDACLQSEVGTDAVLQVMKVRTGWYFFGQPVDRKLQVALRAGTPCVRIGAGYTPLDVFLSQCGVGAPPSSSRRSSQVGNVVANTSTPSRTGYPQ